MRSYLRFSERSNRDEFTDGAIRKPEGWIERIEIDNVVALLKAKLRL